LIIGVFQTSAREQLFAIKITEIGARTRRSESFEHLI